MGIAETSIIKFVCGTKVEYKVEKERKKALIYNMLCKFVCL